MFFSQKGNQHPSAKIPGHHPGCQHWRLLRHAEHLPSVFPPSARHPESHHDLASGIHCGRRSEPWRRLQCHCALPEQHGVQEGVQVPSAENAARPSAANALGVVQSGVAAAHNQPSATIGSGCWPTEWLTKSAAIGK